MALTPIAVLAALLHVYIAIRLVPTLLASWPVAAALLVVWLIASAVLMPAGMRARRVAGRHGDLLAWAGMLCMGLFSSLFVLTLARDAGLVIGELANALVVDPSFMPSLVRRSAATVPLLALAFTGVGLVNARRTARVVSVDVPIDRLPQALEGFTIAQISDIHVGPTIKREYVEAIVERVNALEADMVAITGDLVDGSVRELASHVAPLQSLASRHGSFFVTGNHEYYSGAAAWVAELRRLGVRVLMNEHVVLRQHGADVVVAGVTDYGAGHFDAAQRSDPHAAIAGAPDDAGVRVLLAHQPRSAVEAASAGFDLQLSGHTHGGQFLPWNFFVRFQQPFTAGLHRLQRLWVYTSRGTGYWGPPKRFGAPSEITRIRLVRATAA